MSGRAGAKRTADGPAIPATPFMDWIEYQIATAELDGETEPRASVAAKCGVSVRWLYRYRHGLDSMGRPTATFWRYPVEDALWRFDCSHLWQIEGYEDADDGDQEQPLDDEPDAPWEALRGAVGMAA